MGEAPVTEQERCCDHDWTSHSADRSDECVRIENTAATGRIEMAQNGLVERPNRTCRNPPNEQHREVGAERQRERHRCHSHTDNNNTPPQRTVDVGTPCRKPSHQDSTDEASGPSGCNEPQ